MQNFSYTNQLTAAGLTTDQALVYEVLLHSGEQPASSLAKQLPISRPLVYKVLEDLIEKDLAEKKDQPGKVATFLPKHPIALAQLLDRKAEELAQSKAQLQTLTNPLSSLFNLSSGKPGVQFFEGKDGVWEVLMDSLTATEEIRTYADLMAISQYIPDLNAEYSTIREEKNVQKRGLVIDSPEARSFLSSYKGGVTTTKLISHSENAIPFQTVVQIYDQKISYITLTEKYLIGVIITDQFIANTHKYLFDSLWSSTRGDIIQ